MHKSLSRVKKFLGPCQNLQSTQSHKSQIISPRSDAPTLPELLCQNEDLKQQINKLVKEKEIMQKSIQKLSSQRNMSRVRNSFQYEESPKMRMSQSLKKQYGSRRSIKNNNEQQSSSIQINRFSIRTQQAQNVGEIKLSLELEQERNSKLNQKIHYLTKIVENHERDKKEMLYIIDSLSKKLEDSTYYINKLEKLPNPEQYKEYIKRLENEIKSKQQRNRQLIFYEGLNATNSKQCATNEEIQKESERIHEFVSLKDENYQLRERVANLMLSNTELKGRVLRASVAVHHLWTIKDVEFENLRKCLGEMKSS